MELKISVPYIKETATGPYEPAEFNPNHPTTNSRGSSVGIMTEYWLDDRDSGVRFPAVVGNFFPHRVQTSSGPHTASYQMGTEGSFPGVKWPGYEADHSSPSRPEVKNAWSIPPLPNTYS
jgi:hypothetical protein